MAIQRLQKQDKKTGSEKSDAIEAFIKKGGTTLCDIEAELVELRMTLRLPSHIVERLDKMRKRSPGFISRNSLILQLVQEGLESREG